MRVVWFGVVCSVLCAVCGVRSVSCGGWRVACGVHGKVVSYLLVKHEKGYFLEGDTGYTLLPGGLLRKQVTFGGLHLHQGMLPGVWEQIRIFHRVM